MKIAVIDDERPARSELIHQITEILPQVQICEADSGAMAIELIGRESFDMLFIDINLNDMEGTTLAAAAKKLLPKARIVFATAYSEYAVKAFELGVDDYILKPFSSERVRRVLDKCQSARNIEHKDRVARAGRKLSVNTDRKIILIDIDQIVYAESAGKKSLLHTRSGDYTDGRLLGDLEKKLEFYGFFRVHKSFLVNPDYIIEMFPWASSSLALRMQGFEQDIIPVGREKLKAFRRMMDIKTM